MRINTEKIEKRALQVIKFNQDVGDFRKKTLAPIGQQLLMINYGIPHDVISLTRKSIDYSISYYLTWFNVNLPKVLKHIPRF